MGRDQKATTQKKKRHTKTKTQEPKPSQTLAERSGGSVCKAMWRIFCVLTFQSSVGGGLWNISEIFLLFCFPPKHICVINKNFSVFFFLFYYLLFFCFVWWFFVQILYLKKRKKRQQTAVWIVIKNWKNDLKLLNLLKNFK